MQRHAVLRTELVPCLLLACFPAGAQQPIFSDLHVDKKPGQQTGSAVVTVNGKIRRVSLHALEAWAIEDGQDGLILVLNTNKHQKGEYHLLYCEGATRKRRDLGAAPFASAEMKEQKQNDGTWAFVLSGHTAEGPAVIVADVDGIHGRLEQAQAARVGANGLEYVDSHNAETKTVSISSLLASDMTGVYEVKAPATDKLDYVQFFRDGRAIVLLPDDQTNTGQWWTDGERMFVELDSGTRDEWPRTSLAVVQGIPAGTRLVVRLLQPLSSLKAKQGDSVKAVLISPAIIDGKILIPQGSEFDGTITSAHGVGWALKHETAALTLNFNSVKLPDGQSLAVRTRLYQVENSREKVNGKGSIQGIRSTGTLGYSAENKIAAVANVDPVAYLFTTTSATGALGFAEPEILYPAGTELVIEFTSPRLTSEVFAPPTPPLATSPEDQARLEQFVRKLPFRTMTKGNNKPSDLTNLAFVGSPEALRRAFAAAGWVSTDQLTAATTFQTLKTISGNQSYNQAPMSVLLLDERPPIFTLTKTTNTFSSRHHIRVFDPAMEYEHKRVLTASSTQDIGIAFSSKQKTFIHVIDQYIDNERTKVVNDMELTGCVQAIDLVPRPWVPQDVYNATGDRLRTDGAIAVMRMNDCSNPRATPTDTTAAAPRFERITRDTLLTLKNDIWRANVGYQGVTGAIWLHKYFATKDDLKPETGAWRKADVSGTEFKGVGTVPVDQQPSTQSDPSTNAEPLPEALTTSSAESHRWDPPRYEIAVQGGYLRYPNTPSESVAAFLIPTVIVDEPSWDVGMLDQIKGGWSAGVSFTTNTWRWVSSEFGYQYQRGTFQLGSYFANLAAEQQGAAPVISTRPVGLVTRQFEYNALVHARRRESRWRPYLAVGPALELISLADSPITKAPAPFKLGLQNVGELLAAFEFASTPTLDGGGVYELGLQYGAGIKFRVHPRIMLSTDFRETWAKNPELLRSSYTASYFEMEDYTPRNFYGSNSTSAFRQQRFTLGVAFTF